VAQNVSDGRGRVQLAPRTLAALALHPWTGNVRELGNLIERLSIITAGRTVDVEDLPLKYRPPENWVWEEPQPVAEEETEALREEETIALLEMGVPAPQASESPANVPKSLTSLPEAGLDLRAHLLSIERALVQQALERANGTVAHAARLLNLRRTTLVEKLRKLGIEAATED